MANDALTRFLAYLKSDSNSVAALFSCNFPNLPENPILGVKRLTERATELVTYLQSNISARAVPIPVAPYPLPQ